MAAEAGVGGGSLAYASDGLAEKYSGMVRDRRKRPREREAGMLFSLAEGHINEEEAEDALVVGREALGLFREVGDESGVVDALRLIIHVLCHQDKRKEANQMARDELERMRTGKDIAGEAKMLLSVAEVNAEGRGQKGREEALAAAVEAEALLKEQSDKKMQAIALLTLSNIHLKRKGDKKKCVEEALAAANEATALFRQIRDKRGEAAGLHGIAAVHVAAAAHGVDIEAVALPGGWYGAAKKALGLIQELRLRKLEAYEKLCIAQWLLGENPRKALRLGQEALALCREVKSPQEQAALGVVVQAHLSIKDESAVWLMKEAGEAVKVARDGVARFRARGDMFGEAHALNALLLALLGKQETEAALRVAEKASAAFSGLGDKESECTVFQLTAQLYLKEGQLDKAYSAAQEVASRSRSFQSKVVVLETMYEISIRRGDLQQAFEKANQLRAEAEAAGEKTSEAAARLLISNVHFLQQNTSEAVAVAREAQAIFHDIGAVMEEASALRVIAEVHSATGEYEAALRAAERARKLLQQVGDKAGQASLMYLIAQIRLWLVTNDIRSPDAHTSPTFIAKLSEALEAASDAAAMAKAEDDKTLEASALCTLAQAQIADFKVDDAQKSLDVAMAIFRELQDERNIASVMCIEADVLLVSGSANKALSTLKKALAIFQQHQDTRGEWVATMVIEHITGPPEPEVLQPQWSEEDWQMWQDQQSQKEQGAQQQMPQKQQPQQVAVKEKKNRELSGASLNVANMKLDDVTARLTEILKVSVDVEDDEEVEMDMPLMQLGVTSKTSVAFRNALSEELPMIQLPFTLIFDHPSINEIADMVMEASGR